MTEVVEVPLLEDREIPKLVELALLEVSDGLKTQKQYLLYFLTQIPTAVYEKIRDKVIPATYLSPTAPSEYQMKSLMSEGATENAFRFGEVWIRILEKSSVVDKVSLVIYNNKTQKLTPLCSTKEFEFPQNIVSCINNPKDKFVVDGLNFTFQPKNHPTMHLATVAEERTEKPKIIVTQKDVDEIMSDKDRIREKLEKLVELPPQFRADQRKPPHHVVINNFEMNNLGDELYITVYSTNIERHTIVYTAFVVLADILLLDAFYTDTELFKLWYN